MSVMAALSVFFPIQPSLWAFRYRWKGVLKLHLFWYFRYLFVMFSGIPNIYCMSKATKKQVPAEIPKTKSSVTQPKRKNEYIWDIVTVATSEHFPQQNHNPQRPQQLHNGSCVPRYLVSITWKLRSLSQNLGISGWRLWGLGQFWGNTVCLGLTPPLPSMQFLANEVLRSRSWLLLGRVIGSFLFWFNHLP